LPDETEITERLLPGHVRVSIQIYDAERGRMYRSIGMAESGLRVKNKRELRRLWQQVERATRTGWRDDEQSARADRDVPAAATGK
jgi:hypothetical protein